MNINLLCYLLYNGYSIELQIYVQYSTYEYEIALLFTIYHL